MGSSSPPQIPARTAPLAQPAPGSRGGDSCSQRKGAGFASLAPPTLSLGCNHLGSSSFSLVEGSPQTSLREASACSFRAARSVSEGLTAFLVARTENHWPLHKRRGHYFRLERRGREEGREVDNKCGGGVPW